VRLTGHHHVPCLLHRLGEQAFDLYVFTTYAHDQLAVVLDAALEFGVSLKSTG
jgi:sarcosine oxidase gamma subunit